MALKVMVLESERDAAYEATRELEHAGHTVLSCHDDGTVFPCRGLLNANECPLHRRDVDVALVVRRQTRPQPTPREDGIRCALAQRVPVVVAGARVMSPYDTFATMTIDRTYDVVDVCEEAAHAPIATLGTRATEVLEKMMPDAAERGLQPRATVNRVAGGLRVSISGVGAMTTHECSRMAVRILAGLREIDPFARGIDVVIAGAPTAGAQSRAVE